MRLLEHQAKTLLSDYGLSFTRPRLVGSADDVEGVLREVPCPVVLKAQVPFGGRGKAGAVRVASSVEEARSLVGEMLQTPWRGMMVKQVSIEPRVVFQREMYVGIAWDGAVRSPVALLSLAGGGEVEQADPHQVGRRHFDPRAGLQAYEGRELASRAGLRGTLLTGVGAVLHRLAGAFLQLDAVTAEINPLVETEDGLLLGLDARVEIDDDARYRQEARLAPLGELAPSTFGRSPTPLEEAARRIDEADHRGVAGRVVEFDGDLALLIGGGGASLTVFDAVRRHGGRPANYCEVGGNPTGEKVAALTALLLSKPGVRSLAVIMNVVNNTRADVMARGVVMGIERAGRSPAEVVTVFRVPGSWEPEAKEIMAGAGVEVLGREVSLDQAARLAVERGREHAAGSRAGHSGSGDHRS